MLERMLAGVEEDVADGVAGLGGRAKHDHVVAIGDHPARAAHHAVQALREAVVEGAHGAGEVGAVFDLQDQADVVALHGGMGGPGAVLRLNALQGPADDAEGAA